MQTIPGVFSSKVPPHWSDRANACFLFAPLIIFSTPIRTPRRSKRILPERDVWSNAGRRTTGQEWRKGKFSRSFASHSSEASPALFLSATRDQQNGLPLALAVGWPLAILSGWFISSLIIG